MLRTLDMFDPMAATRAKTAGMAIARKIRRPAGRLVFGGNRLGHFVRRLRE